MALDDTTKTDWIFKKLIQFGRTTNDKAYYEESESNKVFVHQSQILADTIPTTPPATSTSVIAAYTPSGDGRLLLTKDASVAGSKAWKSNLTNWIPHTYNAGYFPRIYESDNTTEIPTTDSSDWYFDYETGILTFENTPPDTTGIYLEGYQYIGAVGIETPGSGIVTQTTEDVTYYVRIGGDDSNDGLTVGNALATIQAAVTKVPVFISHAVIIDVGAGSFAGADISGFTVRNQGTFLLSGNLDTPTISGATSGTADSGSTTQLIDAVGGWTVNELIGMLVLINGEYRVVRDNTATVINFIGPYSGAIGTQAYSIVEQKTIINSDGPFGYPLSVRNCNASPYVYYTSIFGIEDLKMTGNAVANFLLQNSSGITISRLHSYGAAQVGCYVRSGSALNGFDNFATDATYAGFYFQGAAGIYRLYRTFGYDNAGRGFNFAYTTVMGAIYFMYADDNTDNGIESWGSPLWTDIGSVQARNNGKSGLHLKLCRGGTVDIDTGAVFEDNGRYGIEAGEWGYSNGVVGASIGARGAITIQNNTLGGIHISRLSNITLTAATGAGNGGYGLVLEDGSTAIITGATAVTGAGGDARIGTSVLVWATDFASDGDIANNITNGCRMERKD